jgi:hypothetical protein
MDKEAIERNEDKVMMAGYAQQVLENPAHKRAIEHLKKDLELKFESVKATDIEGLQEIKRMFSALDRHIKSYEKMLEDGLVAKNRLQKFLDRMRNK